MDRMTPFWYEFRCDAMTCKDLSNWILFWKFSISAKDETHVPYRIYLKSLQYAYMQFIIECCLLLCAARKRFKSFCWANKREAIKLNEIHNSCSYERDVVHKQRLHYMWRILWGWLQLPFEFWSISPDEPEAEKSCCFGCTSSAPRFHVNEHAWSTTKLACTVHRTLLNVTQTMHQCFLLQMGRYVFIY